MLDRVAPTDEAPLVKLVHAILLSSLRKGATQIKLRPPNEVSFLIDGVWHGNVTGTELELTPSPEIYPRIVRRLGVMASLPMHGQGRGVDGYVHIQIGRFREARWHLEIAGHGPTLRAHLEAIAVDDAPAPPYRS
jgi:type II secretory ATPase GspE/PulE/Tfp pilus assembly ATPase PilB-like protein